MPFLIERDTAITPMFLSRVISQFKTTQLPILNKMYNYYNGKQAIMTKPAPADWKPYNRIVTNQCKYIVDSYNGYITGIDITYSSDEDINEIQNILNYNDVATEDSLLLRNALIFGKSFEIMYIDEEGQQRFRTLDPRDCIDVYYNDLEQELACVIRWYAVNNIDISPEYIVEVYTDSEITIYRSDSSLSSFLLVEAKPNFYGQVPINVMKLNEEEKSIFEPIMGLQDAYNTLLSSSVDDWEAFCDAYLVLAGFDTDEETVKTMKQNRVLVIPEGGHAEYLIKDVNTQQVQNLLDLMDEKIHTISNCPNFADPEKFGAASGISLKYKLLGFENAASNIVKNMTKTLQRRIELICHIINMVGGEDAWRDIQIIFTRNLPMDSAEIVNEINGLRGLVSTKTLISQLPFITDIDAEMEALQEEKQQNIDLYGFNIDREVEEDEE